MLFAVAELLVVTTDTQCHNIFCRHDVLEHHTTGTRMRMNSSFKSADQETSKLRVAATS